MEKRVFKKRSFWKKEWDKIKIMYREGHTIEEIVEEVNYTRGNVIDVLKKDGLIKKKPAPLSPEDREKLIITLFKEGKTIGEIAFHVKYPKIFIESQLKKANLLKKKYRYGKMEFNNENIYKQYKQKLAIDILTAFDDGKTVEDIVKVYNVPKSEAIRILKAAGKK
jgi:hypothetical protein